LHCIGFVLTDEGDVAVLEGEGLAVRLQNFELARQK
jgi:hypothetical protein